MQPDLGTPHQYPSAEAAKCPVCDRDLWGESNRWAGETELKLLGWEEAIDPDLNQDD
ncbi:MAG: hypothetical protein VYA84_11795 [Planctomycetota bacterium]|nr:hypothetical protein [Planctomycetota bacterium]